MELVIAVLALTLLALAADRWGVDSTDGVDSPEWERRRAGGASRGGDEPSAVSQGAEHGSVDRLPRGSTGGRKDAMV